MTTVTIQEVPFELCLVKGMDVLPKGHIRLETGFHYPDRSSIDLFVEHDPQIPIWDGPARLSDLGQTTAWLADLQIRPWLSKKRQGFIKDVLHSLNVQQDGGTFFTTFEKDQVSLQDAVIRLGQACLRVADLTFTRRSSFQSTYKDEVEELLADTDLEYDTDAPLETRAGLTTVDFLVTGSTQRSAVMALSSVSRQAAITSGNDIFSRLYELRESDRTEQRLTIYDDSRGEIYKPDALLRLQDVSLLMPLSGPDDIEGLLAA